MFPHTLWRAVLFVVALAIAVSVVACGSDRPVSPTVDPGAQRGQTRIVAPMIARDGYPGTVGYTVKPGDTLYSIARQFGTTVPALAAMNGITDPSKIETGWHLLVPETLPPPGPSQLITHGDRASNRIALTFDMGGRVEPALDIMNFLVANQVPATIFITGAMVDNPYTDAGRQVVQIVSTHPSLFELGNHSYDHPDFTTITAAAMTEQLLATEASVARLSSVQLRPRFRPPFGAYSGAVLQAVGAAGYSQTIMWDVDTADWKPLDEGGPTATAIVSKVLTNATGGSIVIMHLGGYFTYDALPQIVQGLRARGYELVRISTLLGP